MIRRTSNPYAFGNNGEPGSLGQQARAWQAGYTKGRWPIGVERSSVIGRCYLRGEAAYRRDNARSLAKNAPEA